MSWAQLLRSEPELAARGRRLLERAGVPMAFVATVSNRGEPRLAPVCPIFSGDEVYLSIGAHTPKACDLRQDGRYVLHAFLGDEDEEFQISGAAELVEAADEIRRVHESIAFPVYNAADPVFRLNVGRCLWSRWETPAERPSERRVWRST